MQLPERHVERPGVNNETIPSTKEEIVHQDEQTRESTPNESSEMSRVKLYINIPFVDALLQMLGYAKFLKDILTNKRQLEEYVLIKECSARIQKKLPPKLKDPKNFTFPCTIGDFYFNKTLCDLGVSIYLRPLFRKLRLGESKSTTVNLQLADRSLTHSREIIKDVLGSMYKLIFPADFLILDIEEDKDVPIILGRPFLATIRALIDVQQG
ncbi:uncharacterized protein LOC111365710 [Olea europaea var. sylvestris]|uniref:uncharacterized protein LOC111365710 n=1 Tax=Olea europaea var. sylvestris TaxID=158386 RepID=UPI000C1D7E93|nr:uncharacterized protein LOC111365710 [Olea europaea var. sylvestris]